MADIQKTPFVRDLASSGMKRLVFDSGAISLNSNTNDYSSLDRKVRDKAVESLTLFLRSRTDLSVLDLLKLWKGLFFCMFQCKSSNSTIDLQLFIAQASITLIDLSRNKLLPAHSPTTSLPLCPMPHFTDFCAHSGLPSDGISTPLTGCVWTSTFSSSVAMSESHSKFS